MPNCLPKQGAFFPPLGWCILLLCLLLSPVLRAQQTAVKGRVLSGDSALSSVTVQVKGTSRAVQTDADGRFTISAEPNSTLIFSRVGFTSQQIPLNGRQTLDVLLVPGNTQLADVVVVGYGTQKRIDVTGAVSSVPKDRLSELPVTNVFQEVEGSVPGVTVTNTSSVPGATPNVLVRGQNSITANSGPYIVVDGF